jgi:hypothetical protein
MSKTFEPQPCPSKEPDGESSQQATTSDWSAWINRMPPGASSFHVQGTVSAPTPGYQAELRRAAPQGINPRDLILDLKLSEKPGVWPEVVTPIPVSYVEPEYKGNFSSVLVRLPSREGIPLKVEQVF